MKAIFILFGALLLCGACADQPAPNVDPQSVSTVENTDVTAQPISHNPDPQPRKQQLEHGGYLVEVMGCHDCHSPKVMTEQGPVPDPARLLSGHPAATQLAKIADPSILQSYALFNMDLTAAVGPWGTSFAANLTPDETGLGTWTLDHFSRAMREGKFKGMENGRMLLPPMPWFNFKRLTDEDLAAIWAYLQSIPPVKNVVPAPLPPTAAVG